MDDKIRALYDSVLNRSVDNKHAAQIVQSFTPSDYRWHPLGFMHAKKIIDQTHLLRLHIWPAHRRNAQDPPWYIHNHNFEFDSYIICGTMKNQIYNVQEHPLGTNVLYQVQYDGASSAMKRTHMRINASRSNCIEMQQGSFYHEVAEDYHVTCVPLDVTTATFVAARAISAAMPFVVGQYDGEDRYVFERRVCTPDEVSSALKDVSFA